MDCLGYKAHLYAYGTQNSVIMQRHDMRDSKMKGFSWHYLVSCALGRIRFNAEPGAAKSQDLQFVLPTKEGFNADH